MLYLFGPKETDFINGDSDLIHNTYDEVVDRSKGFYLKFKVTLDKDENYKKIKKEMIISAYTPDGWNQFRVFDIYNHSNYVEVVATQLHYDLNYKKVFPFVVNRTTAQTALNVFVKNFKSDLHNFKFTSNITAVHSFSTDDDLERLEEGHNALEILNRIATRWGGELKVDGYNVHLTHKLGDFTNALLYEHKNISEFVDETSMSEIVTRIHAVSRFRPEREEGSSEEPEEVTIKVVVDSPLINEYAQVYEEDYTNNDARTRDQLNSWARLKYSTNNIDKPARSIKVETNIIDGQEINYGDDLVLKYTKHDVDEIIRCVGYQYNPNSRHYISVTLGSNMNSLSSTITGAVHDSTKNQLSNIEKQVQIIKYAANNVNRVTTGPLPIPDPIEGDMWYYHPDGRPNEVELRIFQNGGWVTIVSDMTGENVRRAIADLELEAEELDKTIKASDQKATEAKETAGVAKSAVDAFGIITQETADKMVDVEQIAANAKTNATDALAKAGEARTQAGKAVGDAQTAMGNAQSALSKASGVESTVSTLSKEVDTVTGKVALKADQTVVDTLSGTVSNHTTTLSQHATAISSKAAQTEVDTVKGTVSTHTSTLSQHAKDISARLTQSQVDNLVSGKGYSTVSYVDTQLTATAGAIRTEMTAVEGKIPTQIGGRNIIRGTSNEVSTLLTRTLWDDLTTPLEVGLYQFQFIAKTSVDTPAFVYFNDNSGKNRITVFGRVKIDLTTEYTYYSGTIEVKTSDGSLDDDIVFRIYNANGDVITIAPNSLKVEKGSIPTDWTPAPEDTMMQNDFTVFKNSYDSTIRDINTELSKTAKTTDLSGMVTETSLATKNYITSGSVNTLLTSYLKTTDLNGKVQETSAFQNVKATTDRFTRVIGSTDAEAKTKIAQIAMTDSLFRTTVRENMSTDGVNLIKGTNTFSESDGLSLSTYNTTYSSVDVQGPRGATQKGLEFRNNQIASYLRFMGAVNTHDTYTFSAWIRRPSGSAVAISVDIAGDSMSYKTFAVKDEWQKIVVTKTVESSRNINIYNFVQIRLTSPYSGVRFWIVEPKLEVGDIATAYSVAPTDNAPQSKVSEIKQTADSIQALVGTTKDSVARAVMTSNLWETEVSKVIDSELEQQYKTVSSRVPNVTKQKGIDYGVVTSNYRTYEYPLEYAIPYGETINVKFIMQGVNNTGQLMALDHINSAGSSSNLRSMYLPAGESAISFTIDASQTYLSSGSKIRLKIYNYPSYAAYFEMWYMKDHQVPIDGINTGAIGSKITQLYDMINMSILGKEGALSRIAIGEEGIQIDGKLLHITAKTFIDNAVIKSAMIDTLDAGKITTGELNASLIRVINLDANSISGNEASFISALFSGTKSTLQITGSGVNVLDNAGRSATELGVYGMDFYRGGKHLGALEYATNVSESGDLSGYNGITFRPQPTSHFSVSYYMPVSERPAYSNTTTYSKGDIIRYISTAYISEVDSNRGNTPYSGSPYWRVYTGSTRVFSVNGRNGNMYMSRLIKPSEKEIYGINLSWGTITGRGTNVRIYNHDRTGGIQINSGDISYRTSNGTWRSLNAWLT